MSGVLICKTHAILLGQDRRDARGSMHVSPCDVVEDVRCAQRATSQCVVSYPDGTYGINPPTCDEHTQEGPSETVQVLPIDGVHPCQGGGVF